jgi:uncharacterized membrane protein YccC
VLWLSLPVTPTLISATLLGITPGGSGRIAEKAMQRGFGAAVGGAIALLNMLLLAYIPYTPMLLALIFVGMFHAAYLTKAIPQFSYGFLQSGLVLPWVLISPTGGIGSMENALDRLIGVAVGMVIADVVYAVWPKVAAR